ncbi:hypothetical protein HIM_07750 [Hirsutella minnesotensis 3608]|uniref:DUF7492 domain-containing protein n=1 Tax=Hirsutella minnesotensis 3608 TaxID=1043627 RepID=A0A0F7ZHK6_9HYPO|nr:hypothetical protein HIM_07750 [Hirsutella minnesotensis 3608]
MSWKQVTSFLALVGGSLSHSWVEQLMVFDENGKMVGSPGYPRGAVSRQNPSFNDLQMQHLITNGGGEHKYAGRICKETQAIGNYTSSLPSLQAWPGAFIALRYQENGHVTLPELSPHKRSSGSVFIYGTTQSSNDDLLDSIHQVWNEDGTGGDRRGRLIATRGFDDGQCYQINQGPISRERQEKYPKTASDPQGADLWCQNDIQLPHDIGPRYSIYWVWDWPTEPYSAAPKGSMEVYTTCIDIDIDPGISPTRLTFKAEQDLNFAGIKGQLN